MAAEARRRLAPAADARRRLAPAALIALLILLAVPALASARVNAHGSARQAYAIGLAPRRAAVLVNRRGRVLQRHAADAQGGVLFRGVTPGRGYRIRQGRRRSAPLTVFGTGSRPPSRRSYGQRIPASGYGYLTTRDGTKLAIDVHLPGGAGPYPTLVEYAGYGYADPKGPDSGIAAVANLLGFAVVDVNMRGTGCSGGAYDYFEPLQSLDGYDVIETVAHQPWVLHHRVGMMGISYGGISQMFVGATDPPHLAAIAPLSVIDNTATTLYAGGILNTGFALNWSQERVHDARPASPTGGQPYALARIRGGDAVCRANQALHGEAVNLIAKVRANAHYVPAVADPLAPVTFVHRIRVPSFVACQWTDEQTGGHCADLAQHFTGTRHAWFTFTNGTHIDSLDPDTFNRWYDFLELYVAHRAPSLSPAVRSEAPLVYSTAMGVPGITLPPDPIQSAGSYAAALAAFQRLAPIQIRFDNGAGGATPGQPYATFARSFARFPIPGTQARSWYLGSGGTLAAHPGAAGAERFTWNPRARPATDFTGPGDGSPGGIWTTAPPYHWLSPPAGSAAAYVSAPLRTTTTVIGGGAVHLYVKASTPSVDLQVTVSEVRPDGKETFVQNGWLRADERTLDAAKSTLLEPVLSLRARDVAPLPAGRFTEVVVPLYYEGHVYRAGSRIRITVTAPNGDQPVWSFGETRPAGTATVTLAHSSRFPARVILPVVSGVRTSTPLPPCPGLRGEPCRTYTPYIDRRAPLAR
ncbi:MAG TPA: CocE/NonD family hydrolase [Solirubrobacteraceae bacterium]|nr:CocE/NonD family hydrolase [Solirubrobacteraceae bacterium]